ncbi:MAG: tetratricopeptide repeat protein [Persicimonas sp.]
MASSEEQSGDRDEKIRAMVTEDFERISGTDDPYVILNLSSEASAEEVGSRYERYEKFYRAENFQRFGDMDLTRKALDIRRAIGRAMVAIQSDLDEANDEGSVTPASEQPELPSVDEDCAAMGEIYFRDGLTYLKLRDLNSAEDCLERAVDYDPSRGIILAYLAYTRFKLRGNDPSVVDASRTRLMRARRMAPQDVEIHVLLARFAINTEDVELAEESLENVETLRPDHPKLEKLQQRVERIR